jgi:hypothetical protein
MLSSSGNCSFRRTDAAGTAEQACKLRCRLHQKDGILLHVFFFKFVNSKFGLTDFPGRTMLTGGISREQTLLRTLQGYHQEDC